MTKLSTKILIVALISITFLASVCYSYVNATNDNSIKNGILSNTNDNNILSDEEHIMMYDAKTGKATKVDMNQVRKDIVNKYGNNIQDLSAYTPSYITNNQKGIYPSSVNASTERVIPSSSPYNKAFRCVFIGGQGSGAIVGLRVGLTAAHCIFDKEGNPYKNWTCYAGWSEGSYWGTPTGWDKVYYDERYFTDGSPQYDWAILALQADSAVGWFGVASYGNTSSLVGKDVSVLGYPGNNDFGFIGDWEYLIRSTLKSGSYTNTVDFEGFAVEGFSGGPVYLNSDEKIVAICTRGNYTNCTGTTITSNMIQIIRNLKGE